MKNLPRSFTIDNEEWYTWSQSPRKNVHVLASVDESTYRPDSTIKMGDLSWDTIQNSSRTAAFTTLLQFHSLGGRQMKLIVLTFCTFAVLSLTAYAQKQPAFRVPAFYSDDVEHDHVHFAHQVIQLYTSAAQRNHFAFASTTNWDDLTIAPLAGYQLILWLDDFPHKQQQRMLSNNI